MFEPLKELAIICRNSKLPNALLFTGGSARDKKKAAMIFIKAVNCLYTTSRSGIQDNNCHECNHEAGSADHLNPCNICRSCVKIDTSMHPDIILTLPEDDRAVIRISQIRAMCSAIASKPHEAKVRLVLIEDAQKMNREASNALLKILEEPPERTLFILIADDLGNILPTVISRCRHIRFLPESKKILAKKLVTEHNVPDKVAWISACSSYGDMQKAKMFANIIELDKNSTGDSSETSEFHHTDWIKRRKWVLRALLSMTDSGGKSPSAAIMNAMYMAEKLGKDMEELADTLSIIKLWFRDLSLAKYGNTDIVNVDSLEDISRASNAIPESFSLNALERIHDAERKLKGNASSRLILEHLFLSLIPGYGYRNR